MSRYGKPDLSRMATVGPSDRRIPVPPPRAQVEVVQHQAPTPERRDPTAATQSLRWVTPNRAQPPDWDAAQAFRIANNTVLTCIARVAAYLSRCPFRTGADPDKPDDYDPRSPLAQLLGPPPGGPNPDTSARRLWAWTVGQRMLAGRFGWEIETNGTRPVALWPLPASALKPIPSTSGTRYFQAYTYGKPGQERRLDRDQVLYDWIPSADDWRQPDPPLRAAYLDTLIAVMQTQYDYAFLKNDARPAAIVITEEFEDQDSFQAFKNQWNSVHQGAENAGRTAFVEATGGDNGVTGAVDVKVLGISPKDAQAAQRYKDRLEQIAIALGVPWSILDASGRTFDNASQEWQNFLHGTLEPLAADLADAINMQLAPRLGNQVGWFDLRALGGQQKTDPVTASVGAPTMVQAQLMTINEARADYGLAPIPGGDRMMTVEEIALLKGAAGPEPAVRVVTEQSVREAPTGSPSQTVEPPADPSPDNRGETAEEAEQRRTKIWTATSSTVRNLERVWEKRMRRLFERQAKSTLARLEAKRGRQAATRGEVRGLADEVFDPQHWIVETADEARVLYEQVAATAGGLMADRFGIAFDLDAPFVAEFIDARANQLAGQVTDTTYQAVKDALAEGVNAGESIPDLAARLRHVFDTASSSRAVTIARTEVISAYNGAATSVASAYGPEVVAGQEWIATRDSRTRDTHAERDGEVVPIGQPFSGGLAYPGDPNAPAGEVVNCRCTVAFLTPDDMHERGGGRTVKVDVARAVIALTRVGEWDENEVRRVLRSAT